MEVVVRSRRAEDLDACVAALVEVHDLDGYPMRWPADPAAWLAVPGTLAATVAELDARVVAHGLLRTADGTTAAGVLADASGRPVVEIAMVSRLFVAPDGRRRGIGAQLLAALIEAGRERCLQVGLDVVAKDTAAIAMYDRAGWRRVATIPCDWAPAHHMHCYLAPQ